MPLENGPNLEAQLRARQVELEFNPDELDRFPRDQPFILLANQLLEGVDELILLKLTEAFGERFVLFPTSQSVFKEFSDRFLPGVRQFLQAGRPVDYFSQLVEALGEADPAGRSMGLIVDFSGGKLRERRRARWLNRLLDTLRDFGLPIVPVRLYAEDGRPTGGMGGRLMQRWLKPGPVRIVVRIGTPIRADEQRKFESRDRFRRFVQSKLFALGSPLEVRRFFVRQRVAKPEEPEPLGDPVAPELLVQDIKNLTYGNLIASQGEFDLFVASALEIPNVLTEIGRLRESTFRQVGEGTGKALDLDEYDLYYHQLIMWDRVNERIVGGYRMGMGDEIFSKFGADGFYISSLFKIREGFYPIMRQSVELGRSYIVPEYQRKRLPLFLLWKGILFFLLRNPQYRYLYGPVSISKYYSEISKGLIVAFLEKYYFDHELAAFLKPRKPFKARVEKVDIGLLTESLGNEMQVLDNFIEDIEPEHLRMPVLLRQYVKLNARFISFNVDPNFSDVLDGFIILDLQEVPYAMIEALKKES